MLKILINHHGPATLRTDAGEDIVKILEGHGVHIKDLSLSMGAQGTIVLASLIVEHAEIQVPEDVIHWERLMPCAPVNEEPYHG